MRINTLGTALMLPLSLLIVIVSDRWMRRRSLLIGGFSAMAIAAYPVLVGLAGGRTGVLLAGQLLFAVLVAFSVAVAPAMFVEMFPTEDRLTDYSLAFNIGLGLVGGTAPMIATWLIEATHMPAAPGLYRRDCRCCRWLR